MSLKRTVETGRVPENVYSSGSIDIQVEASLMIAKHYHSFTLSLDILI